MQFSLLATIVFVAIFGSQAVVAFPFAHRVGESTHNAVANARGARPAPLPFLTPGHQKLEDPEDDDYGFGDEDFEEPRPQKVMNTWGSPPPPFMRVVAERRTARY
ncbi:hypothetical protein AURDEDRAFT_122153 [Auricularia subglabra TFB-10046 SS5]|nr:hypothetical protein AURDEDRAFT_122153 [Auricularia subglabra TFB-10046 SS5]